MFGCFDRDTELCSYIQKHTPAHVVGLMLINEWLQTCVPPPTAGNRMGIHKMGRIQRRMLEGTPSEMMERECMRCPVPWRI